MSIIPPIVIGVIEDDETLLSNYSSFFTMQPGYLLAFAFESIGAFKASYACDADMQPAVILLDINLPGMSGIDGIGVLKAHFPQTTIIMLTAYEDEKNILAALQKGALGYLLKSMSLFRISEALQNMSKGDVPLSASVTQTIVKHLNTSERPENPLLDTLTQRENEIVHCLTDGLTYKEVATRLGITAHTVNQHLKKVYAKMKVNSKAELVSRMLKKQK
jgi:DNA-binding NarL/FixJ family response regulator